MESVRPSQAGTHRCPHPRVSCYNVFKKKKKIGYKRKYFFPYQGAGGEARYSGFWQSNKRKNKPTQSGRKGGGRTVRSGASSVASGPRAERRTKRVSLETFCFRSAPPLSLPCLSRTSRGSAHSQRPLERRDRGASASRSRAYTRQSGGPAARRCPAGGSTAAALPAPRASEQLGQGGDQHPAGRLRMEPWSQRPRRGHWGAPPPCRRHPSVLQEGHGGDQV